MREVALVKLSITGGYWGRVGVSSELRDFCFLGEKVAYSDQYSSDVSIGSNVLGTLIGNKDQGNILYPYSNPSYQGVTVNKFYSSYISFQYQPFSYFDYGTIDFKFVSAIISNHPSAAIISKASRLSDIK